MRNRRYLLYSALAFIISFLLLVMMGAILAGSRLLIGIAGGLILVFLFLIVMIITGRRISEK